MREHPNIAIVGHACRYPDAASPDQLWENVLAGRRAFRQMPAERLRFSDYLPGAGATDDDTGYATEVAVLRDYEFDRERFRIPGPTYRAADVVHWLALEVAADALADAGFADGGLPTETTGVIVGNTLTGEMTRASVVRQRWPYVRRLVDAALADEGWVPSRRNAFLDRLRVAYKSPFPPLTEESLAGALGNTIAGRICGHFDLRGGGYLVDGACASSLLAVITACNGLADQDLDVAIVGGVDVSLDPFELVGFAKAGALAKEEMRVYDERANGFFPGEGCGFIVLMRADDAIAQGRPMRANIRGWGVSSDGTGGITRPEAAGQLLALQRAYERAGIDPTEVAYFEGHGTGTAVGDATELRALRGLLAGASAQPLPVVGSVKANIGHTKAAAGLAGLIKATLALESGILPATPGVERPHPQLGGALRVPRMAEPWPANRPRLAGVSAMGFGGINTHVVLTHQPPATASLPSSRHDHQRLSRSQQDAELILVEADRVTALDETLARLQQVAPRLARAELGDLATALASRLALRRFRAALVVCHPAELSEGLADLRAALARGPDHLDVVNGRFLGDATLPRRLGFLFPGQAAPPHRSGGALRRRFPWLDDLYDGGDHQGDEEEVATEVAQPAIVSAELAGLRFLARCGVLASVAVGHSLGELTAMHWAGAFDERGLLRIVRRRGAAMGACAPGGAMVSVGCDCEQAQTLAAGIPLSLAAFNSPRQTVLAGTVEAVRELRGRCAEARVPAVELAVSHAFHSPMMAPAVDRLHDALVAETITAPRSLVASTVSGRLLEPDVDVVALLEQQVLSPVRFVEALTIAGEHADLFVEVGPGHLLADLTRDSLEHPVLATDAAGPSLRGSLIAVASAFASGQSIDPAPLVSGRFVRPIDVERPFRFFANPCEKAPLDDPCGPGRVEPRIETATDSHLLLGSEREAELVDPDEFVDPVEVVRALAAEHAELPLPAVTRDAHLLGNLHLNSITVSELAQTAARRLGRREAEMPLDLADATIAELAAAIIELPAASDADDTAGSAALGVRPWLRAYEVMALGMARRPAAGPLGGSGDWKLVGDDDLPAAGKVHEALAARTTGGTLVCLRADTLADEETQRLLEAARHVTPSSRLVIVHDGRDVGGFARAVHLETPGLVTTLVDAPFDQDLPSRVVAEVEATNDFVDVRYDRLGRRTEPVWRLLPPATGDRPLDAAKVLLVTGGGKGIGAEVALHLARTFGVKVAILGRSRPEEDVELAANLERFRAAGAHVRYVVTDVGDVDAVRRAISLIHRDSGPIGTFIHAAGVNVPQRAAELTIEEVEATVRPKVNGLRNVLGALETSTLDNVVVFGSIIARSGLPGEAHYALANDKLRREVEHQAAQRTGCRWLVAEWSVWSGAGMGERLGRIAALTRQGITPITIDAGVQALARELGREDGPVARVLTARFGTLPTVHLEFADAALPLRRYLETPIVHYPRVELIVEVSVSNDTDPYLADHEFRGSRLLPAVFALEAMAQVAGALVDTSSAPAFEDVSLLRPIVVEAASTLTLRICAVVSDDTSVELVIRCDSTHFAVDHVRARCRFGDVSGPDVVQRPEPLAAPADPEPAVDLYRDLLFHGPAFRRVTGYRMLTSTGCVADVTTRPGTWFSAFLPQGLTLGDPAARDACIHAIQACVPHDVILPTGIDRLVVYDTPGESGTVTVHAREVSRGDGHYVYDLDIVSADGRLLETWRGLRLHVVETRSERGPWRSSQLGPVLEHHIGTLQEGSWIRIAVTANDHVGEHTALLQRLLGDAPTLRHRPDGRPELDGGPAVSFAHTANLALGVAGSDQVACDVEAVARRSEGEWASLLGTTRDLALLVAEDVAEPFTTAATRVWTALECARKLALPRAALTLTGSGRDGWVCFRVDCHEVHTLAVTMTDTDAHLVVATTTAHRLAMPMDPHGAE